RLYSLVVVLLVVVDLFCISFSFSCSRDHRGLHSFPTRRSSDLASRLPPDAAELGSPPPSPIILALRTTRPHRGKVFRRAVLGAVDRKSTRLNSSHGSISYAVFCLKKKKRAAKLTTISSSTVSNS